MISWQIVILTTHSILILYFLLATASSSFLSILSLSAENRNPGVGCLNPNVTHVHTIISLPNEQGYILINFGVIFHEKKSKENKLKIQEFTQSITL